MSNPSKSQNSEKSSRGSLCPPTARSPSLTTASALTDPHDIPTALSNSVTTARGATPSEFEPISGLSDTSAGSGRASSTNPATAKSPTSPEILMNDLRRGSLFGRQTKSQASEPHSITNITFTSAASQKSSTKTALSSGTFPKTAPPRKRNGSTSRKSDVTSQSQLGSISAKSTKTAKSRFNKSAISTDSGKRKSVSRKLKEMKMKSRNPEILEKSTGKSAKSGKASASRKPEASEKSGESAKAPVSRKPETSEKSGKSAKVQKTDASGKSAKSGKAPVARKPEASGKRAEFGKSGVVKQGDKQKDQSVYFPGVVNAPKAAKSAGRKAPPPHNWPETGKCTRNMDALAPPTTRAPPVDNTVYDVANLAPSQRGLPPSSSGAPKSLFGARNAPKSEPLGNKIVVFGQTADGKTTVRMTIDMQIVAGVGMGGANEPVELKPKKIQVTGMEYDVDSKK